MAAAAVLPSPNKSSQLQEHGAVYKTIGGAQLAMHFFEPLGHQLTDRRAAALFFFGGGWSGGTVEQFAPHCRYLASRGMIGVVADYRVAQKHGTTPWECVKDAKSAVRWLRHNAESLGIDGERIAVGGGSAGGHIAAATATIAGLNETGEDVAVSAVPNALLLFNPVYDNGPGGYGHSQFGDRYLEISPFHNIRSGLPPTIVFLGTNDSFVPVETAQEFQKQMRDVGSRSELLLYKGQPHGFFNSIEFRKSSSPRFFYETVHAMDRFLASLGYLQGEPTVKAPRFDLRLGNEHLEVWYGKKQLAQYEFDYDDSTPELRQETYKPYLHLFGKNGERTITKGPGGRYTHHRGIFIGYSRMQVGEKRYDLWHMKHGVQIHREFSDLDSDEKSARFTSRVDWVDNQQHPLLAERRTMTFKQPPGRAYELVEMCSSLTAVADDVVLTGDPEHAGVQLRVANDIVPSETEYFFHQTAVDSREVLDLPWVGMSFQIGKQRYSVVMLNHPDNPQSTRFSAYRDYGRFGAYPEFEISRGDTVTLRYQWLVTGGRMLPFVEIEAARQAFVQK